MVGAMSPHPSRLQIPEPAVAEFADAAADSGHGLVLSSFGSNAAYFGTALGLEDYEQLALGFADLAPVSDEHFVRARCGVFVCVRVRVCVGGGGHTI